MTKNNEMTVEDVREGNRERQKKFQEKKKKNEINNSKKIEKDHWESWKKGKILIESPAHFGLLSLVIFLTTMLVIMQAEVYMAMDHSHAIALAILTEVLLVVLFTLRFQGVLWLVNAGMITLLVLYNLGLLGYGVYRDSLAEVQNRAKDNILVISTGESLRLVQTALAVATKKEESGNISRLSRQLKELGGEYNNQVSLAVNNVIESIKMWGLIVLRLIMMVSNGLLAGRLHRLFRESSGLPCPELLY